MTFIILWLAKKFAAIFGITDVFRVQKWIKMILIVAGITILIIIGYKVFRFVFPKKGVTIDQAAVQKINAADEKTRKDELHDQIVKNQDVIKTNDNRTELQNLDTAEKNREIDRKVAEADKQVQEKKAQGHDVTQEELHCILAPADCQ